MVIKRNTQRPEVDPAAIAAFGAAAEAQVEIPEPTAPPAAAPKPRGRTKASGGAPGGAGATAEEDSLPKSTIVRWDSPNGDVELRNRIHAYHKRERYTMHESMLRAMRIGIEALEKGEG